MAIIGLGYVGLPLAVAFAEAGFAVTGIDIDAKRVAALNAGHSHVSDIPAYGWRPCWPIAPRQATACPPMAARPPRCWRKR
ncbi:MAG: NAD(P)-binding domain-containing protein [Caldilineaceae bacterium]